MNKTDNEIISAWRGECRHIFNGGGYCNHCHKSDTELDWGYRDSPKQEYDSDPAAWIPELYALIEERGLAQSFIDNLCDLTFKRNRMVYHMIWDCMSAIEAQKAQALSQAIEEEK